MNLQPITIKKEVCADLDAASQREWLETNGLGGFASSTVAGMNTRRYHGLLTAATTPPAGRMLLLSKLEETLVTGAERFDLALLAVGRRKNQHRQLAQRRLRAQQATQ